MTRKLKAALTLVAFSVAAALGGCGGGDDDFVVVFPPPDSELPASALSSSEGLVEYVRQLIATSTDEVSEPVALGNVSLPTSDTLGPLPVQ